MGDGLTLGVHWLLLKLFGRSLLLGKRELMDSLLQRLLEGEGVECHLKPAVRSWQLGRREQEASRRE